MGWRPGGTLLGIVVFSSACFVCVGWLLLAPARHDAAAHAHATARDRAALAARLPLRPANASRPSAGSRGQGLDPLSSAGDEAAEESLRYGRAALRAALRGATPAGGAGGTPALPRAYESWNGWTASLPADKDWDFFGMPVPPSAARARVLTGALRANYALNRTFLPSERLKQYSYGDDPAFRYPDPLDRLFIIVSLQPFAMYFPRIATDEEVDEIRKQAGPRLARSQVALTKDGRKRKESSTQEVRTSKSTWVTLSGVLSNLERRVVNITNNKWHEPMNVLKYGHMQHYDSHHDYFDPNMYGKQTNNRMATMFVWLENTEEGGWTTLPRANGNRMPRNYKEASCTQGLQCKPVKGAAILFYGMRPDRSLDPYSLHGGCDVEKGEKWAGTIWFRANTPAGSGRSHE